MARIIIKSKAYGTHFCLVDDDDFKQLNKITWHVFKTPKSRIVYAVTAKGVRMHRLIMGVIGTKQIVDHKDHDGLNNRKANLRIVTHGQNLANSRSRLTSSSKYLGVSWSRGTSRWIVDIQSGAFRKRIGSFKNENEAALAYNEAAKKIHGEFANLNEID